MTKKKPTSHALTIPASDILRGDTVHAGEGDSFVVAGTRRNPDDFRVRLYDMHNTLRAELEPTASVEVER